MARNLRIALFGNDWFSFATARTLHKKFLESGTPAEFLAIHPQFETSLSTSTPCYQYNQFIKANPDAFKKKMLRGEWKPLHKLLQDSPMDYGVLCSFPSFDSEISKHFTQHTLYARPSLLPDLAGEDPIPNAIFQRKELTGVTIMKIEQDSELLLNSVLVQQEMKLEQSDNYATLSDKLGSMAGEELAKLVQDCENNAVLCPSKIQDTLVACSKLKRLFCVCSETAETVMLLHKSLKDSNYPPVTGLRLHDELVLGSLLNPTLDIPDTIKTSLLQEKPGTLVWNQLVDEEGYFVRCREGSVHCTGLRLMQPRKQSRGLKLASFLRNHLARDVKSGMTQPGKALLFNVEQELARFSVYRNTADKKFTYLL